MHSPFGIMQQVIKETGWTKHYVLWRVSWPFILMMMADRPGMKKKSEKDKVKKLTPEEAAKMRKQFR